MGTSTNFTIAQNVKIYDNFAHNQPSDLRLEKGQLINVKGLQSNNDSSYIGIKLADNYDNIITSGFANNNSCNPKDIFYPYVSSIYCPVVFLIYGDGFIRRSAV